MSRDVPSDGPVAAGSNGSVRALLRGLEILRYINSTDCAAPSEIARALDLPRPTVHRLLHTLEEAGYLAFSASNKQVRVTRLAAALGDGAGRQTPLFQAAAPLMAKYTRRLVWPLALNTYENAAMRVQETTHSHSPLSIDHAMAGQRLPMLRTSSGRAYLAFCPEAERAVILDHLRRLGDPADAPLLQEGWLLPMLAQTRAQGFALRDRGEFRPQTSSITAPLCVGGEIVATLSLIWTRQALPGTQAMAQLSGPLQDLCAEIAEALEHSGP